MPSRVSTVRHCSAQVLEQMHMRAPSACSFASIVRTPGFSSTVPSALKKEKRSVTFFLGQCLGEKKEPTAAEVKNAAWVPVNQALNRINFEPDREVLKKALTFIEEKPTVSDPI